MSRVSQLESRSPETTLSKKVRSRQSAPFKRCCQISTPVPVSRGGPLTSGQAVCAMVFGVKANKELNLGVGSYRTASLLLQLFHGHSDFLLYSLLRTPDRLTQGLMNVTARCCECFTKHNPDYWLIPLFLCYRNCRTCHSAPVTFPTMPKALFVL